MSNDKKPKKLSEIIKKFTKRYILDNAEKEKQKAYDIRSIYQQMELDLISSMKRAFYYHQREQNKEGFEWEQWQLSKLRAMEDYRKRNKEIIGEYSEPIQEAIDRELRAQYSNGEDRVTKLVNKINEVMPEISIELPKDLGKSINTVTPKESAFFGLNEKKLEALISTVKNDLSKAEHSVLRRMDDIYRQTLFKTQVYMQSGVKTLNQAIDMATKDFLDKGIDSIEYKNGRRVNIASYAEMCLRTASQRATFLGEGTKRNEYGIHTVVVSAHANTCPHCAPWQGKVLIDDVFSNGSSKDGAYPLLSEAIKKNFLHPNCRHTLITYFPGISKLPEIPDEKEAIKTYEAEQKQRYYERQIRKWKRVEAGSVDIENQQIASTKVREYERKIGEILDKNKGLRRNTNREKADIRSIREINYKKDLKQYESYKEVLGSEAPKTLQDFQDLKYNDIKEWSTMKDYFKARTKGYISAFSSYGDYKAVKKELSNKIIGIKTADGLEIKSYSKHMVDRILGTSNDPKTGRPRSGTTVDGVLDALINPVTITETKARKLDKVAETSKKYIGRTTTVSVNPDTGNLIQCNPTDSDYIRRIEKNAKEN